MHVYAGVLVVVVKRRELELAVWNGTRPGPIDRRCIVQHLDGGGANARRAVHWPVVGRLPTLTALAGKGVLVLWQVIHEAVDETVGQAGDQARDGRSMQRRVSDDGAGWGGQTALHGLLTAVGNPTTVGCP